MTQTPTRPARTARKRGEGQWALGYREPLNPNERSKKDDDALNVRARIENIYAKRGFASIDPATCAAASAGRASTPSASPASTAAGPRCSSRTSWTTSTSCCASASTAGSSTTEQLRAIGGISTEFARDTADLTDRQNVQLHWIRIEDVPEIWRRLEAVGLSTTEACGDCPRVILGSPVAGIAADEIIDPTPAIRRDRRALHRRPGVLQPAAQVQDRDHRSPGHDVVPRDQRHRVRRRRCTPSYGPGFDLWVGGGLSTNPMLAQRLGAWVPLDEVPEVWAGVVGDLPRLRLPPAAAPGPAQVPGRRLGR